MNVLGVRTRIRPTRKSDLKFLQALWNDGSVMRSKGFPNGLHVTDACMESWWAMTPQAQFPQALLTDLASPHCLVELLDGTPIGELSYSFDAQHRASIEMKLLPDYWGQGFATEVVMMAVDELFTNTPTQKILVEPDLENGAAKQVLQHCGFQPAPTDNHPNRWACSRVDFAHRDAIVHVEVA